MSVKVVAIVGNTDTLTFFFSYTFSTHTSHAKEGLLIHACSWKMHFEEAASRQTVSEKKAWMRVRTQSEVDV